MFELPVSKEIAHIRRLALGDMVYRSAIRFGNRLAVVDGDIRMTYSEVDAASSQFAHYLLQTFPQGSHVAMLCANSADMLVATNGIHKAGSVWVPINMMLATSQRDYIIRHAESTCVVIDEEIAQQAEIAALLTELKLPVIVTRASSESRSIGKTFAQTLEGQSRKMPEIDIDSNQPALIM
jgi:long-chain acyl-CoA synthetase